MAEVWQPNDPKSAYAFFRDFAEFLMTPEEVHTMLAEHRPIQLIDVRGTEDYYDDHIPGAVSIPEARWHELGDLNRTQLSVLYCGSWNCPLSRHAALEFAAQGYPVRVMIGGLKAWKASGYDSEAVPGSGGSRQRTETEVDEFTRTRMESHHHSSWPR